MRIAPLTTGTSTSSSNRIAPLTGNPEYVRQKSIQVSQPKTTPTANPSAAPTIRPIQITPTQKKIDLKQIGTNIISKVKEKAPLIIKGLSFVLSAIKNPGETIVKAVENKPLPKTLGFSEAGAFGTPGWDEGTENPVTIKDIRTLSPAGKKFLSNTLNKGMGGLAMQMPATSSLAGTLPGLSKAKAAIGAVIGGGLPIIQSALADQKINWWDVSVGTLVGGYIGLLVPKGMPEGTSANAQKTLNAIDTLQKNGIGDMADYKSWILKNPYRNHSFQITLLGIWLFFCTGFNDILCGYYVYILQEEELALNTIIFKY